MKLMQRTIFIITCVLLSLGMQAQSFIGAWEGFHTSKNGDNLKSVVIFADGYQVISTYEAKTGKFVSTNGGTWKLEGSTMTEKVEFDTNNPERVGSEVSFEVFIDGSKMGIVGTEMTFTRIDNGSPGALQGAWLISGRKRGEQMQSINTNRPRKTMKILSGTRFQWIAYNTETKQFMGTGGGTYTTSNGKYTENIRFFSRDDTRVGARLQFDYDISDGNWHHSGLSSKGDPIYEIWSIRK